MNLLRDVRTQMSQINTVIIMHKDNILWIYAFYMRRFTTLSHALCLQKYMYWSHHFSYNSAYEICTQFVFCYALQWSYKVQFTHVRHDYLTGIRTIHFSLVSVNRTLEIAAYNSHVSIDSGLYITIVSNTRKPWVAYLGTTFIEIWIKMLIFCRVDYWRCCLQQHTTVVGTSNACVEVMMVMVILRALSWIAFLCVMWH